MKKMLNSASHHRNTNQNHNEAPSTPVKTSTTKKKKKSINNKVCRACGEKDTTPAEGVQIGRRSSSRSEAKH